MTVLRMVSVLIAAIILGIWFKAELKAAQVQGAPWYKPYLSPPGIMIILAILLLPILARVLQ